MAKKFENVDEYVAAQPAPVGEILEELRRRGTGAFPAATETISYDIPKFTLGNGKRFVYVGAWTEHISVYPIPDGDDALQRDIERHRAGKGTLKFMLAEPFPYDLFDRLVQAAATRD